MWQIHPSVPPVPIQNPGVKSNHRIPARILPLYSCPTPGIMKLKTPAKTGSRISSSASLKTDSTYEARFGFVRAFLNTQDLQDYQLESEAD